MQTEVDGNEDYPGLTVLLKSVIQKFRISVGDVSVDKYDKWENTDPTKSPEIASQIAIAIIWFFWFMNIYFMLIIMLNLLIAQVSQIFEKVMTQGKQSIYKERAQLNKLVFQILYLFQYQHLFEMIIIRKPQQASESFDYDSYITVSDRINRFVQDQLKALKSDLIKNLYLIFDSMS